MTENDYREMSGLLFADVDREPEHYLEKYGRRELPDGARVTRFAPSPTGFLHIGGLFAAYVSQLTARASGGIFYLRIEDTDKKREIEDGVTEIIKGLEAFDIVPDEGVVGFGREKGDYGPYTQSARREIYRTFAKSLVEKGLAYPCFCTSEELSELREKQEELKVCTGYYGQWAKHRDITVDEARELIEAGKPYVVRLKSPGDPDKKIVFDDMIKGKIEMPENIQDAVILKTDGIPTYHFAHAVDDYLMGTTHVIRGDEWISSVPLHIQLFRALGFKPPKYAHIAPIMKEENGGKRKLSKRKDPEAAVTFYAAEGYPKQSVKEYLLTLANSNFEDWRKANRMTPREEFPFNLKKMSQSGALFDLVKLNDVSKNVISLMEAGDVYDMVTEWAKDNDGGLYSMLTGDREYAVNILSIDRGGSKPRKDIAKWSDVRDYVSYFYDEMFKYDGSMPENVTAEDRKRILEIYKGVYDENDGRTEWFEKIKAMCPQLGYTANIKEYKKTPELYRGHVGDLSSVIRVAVTGRRNTPDLCSIMKLLGRDRVMERIDRCLSEI